MPIFGFDSWGDMIDGGGRGARGPGGGLAGLLGGGSGGSGGGNSNLLSGLGSLLGGLVGGPMGAALGAGLGTIAGGGTVGSALQAGAGSFVQNKLGPLGGLLAGSLAPGGGGTGGFFQELLGGQGSQTQGTGTGSTQQNKKQQPMGGLLGLLDSPLVMAALLKATEPKNVRVTTPEQREQMRTGERLPDYQGTPAFDYRYGSNFAMGGMVRGPGTGTSDSIPSRIYQDGKPVQEARLSDGEFVMTNRAVRGAGNGDRGKGAAEMYRMMRQLERRA
jgi:hypothetical protein